MKLRSAIVWLMVIELATASVTAQQGREPSDVWRAFAERLAPGAFVTVHMTNGLSVDGHLIGIRSDNLIINKKTRVPVPIVSVAFDEIASIDLKQEGLSPGGKVLLGVGITGGLLFMLFLAMLSRT